MKKDKSDAVQHRPKTAVATAATVVAAVMWGTAGIYVTNLNALGVTSFQISTFRALATAILFFLLILIRSPKLLRVKPRDIPLLFSTGVFSFALFSVAYMASIGMNSLSVAAILLYTSPVWVTVFSVIFFREQLTVSRIAALAIAVLGCAAVSVNGGDIRITSVGLAVGLVSGVGYGIYSILIAVAVRKYSLLTVDFYVFIFASLALAPISEMQKLAPLLTKPELWMNVFGIVVIATALPFGLYSYALRYIPAATASILSILEPIVACIVGFLVFGQSIGWIGIVGIVLVCVALVLLEVSGVEAKRKKYLKEAREKAERLGKK